MLGMTEVQLFVLLPHMLSGQTASPYRAIAKRARAQGVKNWSEATQYFLRAYATPNATRNATNAFRTINQHLHKDENTFAARVNISAFRCGKVHDEDEMMIVFVDGLDSSIHTVVARFCDNG